jgi:tetratricopeptide (TPR) repeat protein
MVGDPKWGGLARKAAGRIDEGGSGASATWRQVMDQARAEGGEGRDPRHLDEWVRVDPVRDEASSAVARGRSTRRAQPAGGDDATEREELAEEIRRELATSVGSTRAPRLEQRLGDASRAFQAERYTDSARILRKLTEEAPGVAAARELYGLTLYRQGKWRPAIKQLEAFRLLTGSTEQHPVLADCYRAVGQDATVEELWDELRQVSPSAELVVEGRIVVAGMRADRGDLPGAIRLLEDGWRLPGRPQEHHLRRGYALADLYERAGDVARARQLFERLERVAPDFADVRQRRRALA